MTTPRPTADLVTSPPDLTGAPDLPDWLPDEATLNRLAGEFFAALPGSSPAGVPSPGASALGAPTAGGSATTPTGGADPGVGREVEHAPRVDVPARSNEISRVPGDDNPAASSPIAPSSAGSSLPVDGRAVTGGVPDLPGVAATEPAAGSGYSPGRSIPDLTELTSGLLGAEGLGPVLPEGPIVPGLTGLQLADPGELTPAIPGSTAPRPDEPVPGLPASDQLVGAGGLPNGPPDVTAAALVCRRPLSLGGTAGRCRVGSVQHRRRPRRSVRTRWRADPTAAGPRRPAAERRRSGRAGQRSAARRPRCAQRSARPHRRIRCSDDRRRPRSAVAGRRSAPHAVRNPLRSDNADDARRCPECRA